MRPGISLCSFLVRCSAEHVGTQFVPRGLAIRDGLDIQTTRRRNTTPTPLTYRLRGDLQMISERPDTASGGDGNSQRGLLAHAAMVKQCFPENKHYLLQTSARPREHQAMLDSKEIKRRFGLALKATPGLQLKDIAEACEVTPQAVGDWKRTGRIDKRHFQKLSELTHTGLSYWLDERGAASAANDVSEKTSTSPEQTELHLIVALMAQALAASTPVAGRDLVAAIRDRVGARTGTLAGDVVTALESQLADLADTFPRKHSARESR